MGAAPFRGTDAGAVACACLQRVWFYAQGRVTAGQCEAFRQRHCHEAWSRSRGILDPGLERVGKGGKVFKMASRCSVLRRPPPPRENLL